MAQRLCHNDCPQSLPSTEDMAGTDPREGELTPEHVAAVRAQIAHTDLRIDLSPAVLSGFFAHLADLAERLARLTEEQRAVVLASVPLPAGVEAFLSYAPATLRQVAELFAEPLRVEERRLDRRQLLPLSTAPWAAALHTGYANAARDGGYDIVRLERGFGIVTADGTRGQLRFAPPPSAAGVAETFPSITPTDAHELAKVLKQDGRLRGSVTAMAAVQFTVAHPYELIEWDDRFRATFGFKRPGGRPGRDREQVLTEARRNFDRRLYSRLYLGQRAEYIGMAFSHGPNRVGEWLLYSLGYKDRSAEGLPRYVRFDPVGISADILHNPKRSEVLGSINDILALPETTPGRWATALIVFLLDYWSQRVTKPECRPIERANGSPGLAFPTVTRDFVFGCQPPDPPATPANLLNRGRTPPCPAYFDEAVALLIDAKLVDACIATPTRYRRSMASRGRTRPRPKRGRPALGRAVHVAVSTGAGRGLSSSSTSGQPVECSPRCSSAGERRPWPETGCRQERVTGRITSIHKDSGPCTLVIQPVHLGNSARAPW